MRHHTLIATAFATLALPALQAGEVHSTAQTTYTPPAPTEHIGWYLGGGIDYMIDAEDAFYNAHVGYDFGNGSSLFLESGWLGEEQDVVGTPAGLFFLNADIDIVPVTLNYKYEHMFTDSFGVYVGAGLGAAHIDTSIGFFDDSSWEFTAQAFAGVVYNVSPNFEIYGGVRYMWLDDVKVGAVTTDNLDDVGIGAGIRWNF